MRSALAALLSLILLTHPEPAFTGTAGGKAAILPFTNSASLTHLSWMESSLSPLLSLLLSSQTAWEGLSSQESAPLAEAWSASESFPSEEAKELIRSLNIGAVITGSFREHTGSLRIKADLYYPADTTQEPVRLTTAGKTSQLPELVSELSNLIGEALEARFLKKLRPPILSPPTFLLILQTPSFGPKDPYENFAQTESFLLSALKIDPNNADAYFKIGTFYARNGLLDRSLSNLKAAVELSPKYSKYHYGLGVVHYLTNHPEEALTEFLQATVIDENFADGFLALSFLYRETGDFSAARSALEKAAKIRSADPQVALALGVIAYLEKKPEEARQHFESAKEVDPRCTAAYNNLGFLEWDQGKVENARREFGRALASQPNSPEALNNMVLLESRQGLSGEPLEKLRKALESGRQRQHILYNLGTLQLQWGQWLEAATTFRKVLETETTFPPARNNLGIIKLFQGELDESLSNFTTGLKDHPDFALLHYNLALTQQLRKKPQQSLVHYLKAIQAKRDLLPAHINLGILFETLGRPEKALTEYLKALSFPETSPDVYTYLGLIYAQRGYGSMADETIRKTTLVDTKDPAPYYFLALSQEEQDPGKAVDYWRQFLATIKLNPNRSFWVPVAEKHLADLGETP